ncbi:MAG: hypothetical protein JWP87_3940 [Labilithrix sp.]|nr:hypothetical protein [Labilithrix sp.]
MTAMLVGPDGGASENVAQRFERARMRVVRVAHAAAACERLAVAMPQVVIVLGTLRSDERDALADRATAVGALVMHVDPELDEETLQELVARAAQAAIERKLQRDESGPAGAVTDRPDADDDVDSNW